MKKTILFVLAACFAILACEKTVKVPLSYNVETSRNTPVADIYIPDTGNYTMSLLVKYLGGSQNDKVTVSLSGLPADITLAQDTFSKVPTYQADYVFITRHAAHGTYPVTVTTSAIGSEPKTYNFNVNVVSADCAAGFWGNLASSNGCSSRDFTYTATGTSTGVTNELNIVNFGGYGSNTNTRVLINCNKDSVTVPSQNIGNATILEGYGTINGNTMVVYYTASNTPGGFPETCTATLVKQ